MENALVRYEGIRHDISCRSLALNPTERVGISFDLDTDSIDKRRIKGSLEITVIYFMT